MSHTLNVIKKQLPELNRLVAIDMETTGNRAPTSEMLAKMPKGMKPPGLVIEIGCVEMLRDGESWTKGETWSTRVRPDAPISPGSIKVHGIRPNDLNKAPRFNEIADALLAFLGDAPLVAHASLNEYGYLNYEFRRAGRCKWDEDAFPEDRFFCTQKLSHEIFPRQSGSLDALCDRLWIDRSDRFEKHGALLDADLTADAFVKFITGDVDQKNMEIS
jgi:DNA polymerase III subunit epsilon